MGYYKGLVNASFTKDSNKIIFFPYGLMGRGYVIGENEEVILKSFLKKYYIFFFASFLVVLILYGYLAVLLLLFYIPYYLFKIKKYIKGKNIYNKKVTRKDSMINMAKNFGLSTIIFLFISSTLFFVLSIFLAVDESLLLGGCGILFFGIGLVYSVILMKYHFKYRNRK